MLHGKLCRICGTQYFRENDIDPAEPCRCGQMADCGPWRWDRWRGLRNYSRYWLSMRCYQLGDWLAPA